MWSWLRSLLSHYTDRRSGGGARKTDWRRYKYCCTSIAEQAGKGHHRAVAVNPSSLSRNRIVLTHRTRSPRPPPDQVRSIASGAAQRAAKQQPKEMRSASLSYVKQAIKERWKPTTKIDKHIRDAKKSIAARYLQLKSGHAITGAHLFRIGKVQNAQCWWCGRNSQTVSHLLLECQKWRRQRNSMLRKLCARKVLVSER